MHDSKHDNAYRRCFLYRQKAGLPLIGIRQRGSVLLVVTFSLIVLFGLAALVLDVGRMYIIKNQLQNAADAGALRGAKVLNGTASALATAESKAREAALTNEFKLVANPLTNGEIDVYFSATPFPASWTSADAACRGAPANCFFVRVDTRASGIASFFAGIIGVDTNAAKALAVAGRYTVDVLPLAACAIDIPNCPDVTPSGTCGYTKGLSYKVSEVNPIGPGTLYWIDPEATTPTCTITSANAMRPYVCQGKVSAGVKLSPTVYTNTGISSGPLLGALDSRFGDYPPASQCSPDTAPPDTNIMQYLCPKFLPSGAINPDCKVSNDNPSVIANWTGPLPVPPYDFTRQAAHRTSLDGVMPMTFDTNGVIWSASLPATAPISGRASNLNYPASDTPYSQTGGSYFRAPTGAGAAYKLEGRRLINLIIVQCTTSGGVCRPATVKGIGRFLLTRRSDISSDKEIYTEFVRMLTQGELMTEIKLYR